MVVNYLRKNYYESKAIYPKLMLIPFELFEFKSDFFCTWLKFLCKDAPFVLILICVICVYTSQKWRPRQRSDLIHLENSHIAANFLLLFILNWIFLFYKSNRIKYLWWTALNYQSKKKLSQTYSIYSFI